MPQIRQKPCKRTAKAKTKDCPHCKPGPETYHYLQRQYVYDVDQAREIVQDGREAVELEPEDVEYSVDNSRIFPQHLEHVQTQYPGIMAHIWFPTENGELVHGHLLIDGNHRAARCLQLGLPFYVHLLSEVESRQVLLKSPIPRPETVACRESKLAV